MAAGELVGRRLRACLERAGPSRFPAAVGVNPVFAGALAASGEGDAGPVPPLRDRIALPIVTSWLAKAVTATG